MERRGRAGEGGDDRTRRNSTGGAVELERCGHRDRVRRGRHGDRDRPGCGVGDAVRTADLVVGRHRVRHLGEQMGFAAVVGRGERAVTVEMHQVVAVRGAECAGGRVVEGLGSVEGRGGAREGGEHRRDREVARRPHHLEWGLDRDRVVTIG